MIIGVDGNEANVEKRLGVGEYAFELLLQFNEHSQSTKFIIYLKNKPREDMPEENEHWKYKVVGPSKVWTQVGLPFHLFLGRPKPDVFFTPTHYAPRFSKIPTAISIMDVSYLYFPGLFKKRDLYKLKNWTSYSVKRARKIFTISWASKNDIIKEYKVNPEKVIVTYPGLKSMVKTTSDTFSEKYHISGDFILFVGTLQPRKNLARLIEAFSKIQNSNISLVIVGKKGWLYEEIMEAPKKFGVEDRVKFLSFVEDSQLQALYKNALFFILPSLYEGFGLPALEAMALGCPVITSNVSSLPEVGGTAVLYIDPKNTEDIKDKMQKLITDKKLRDTLIEKGKKQVKKFSWEKTAKETLDVLIEIAQKNNI